LTRERVIGFLRRHESGWREGDEARIHALVDTVENNERILREFKPRWFSDRAVFVYQNSYGMQNGSVADPWLASIGGGFDRHPVPFGHEEMIGAASLARIAEILAVYLTEDQ
jgi:hypothetical protein